MHISARTCICGCTSTHRCHYLSPLLSAATAHLPFIFDNNTSPPNPLCVCAGGSSNAYTSQENTNYYFDVQAQHLNLLLDMFAQVTHQERPLRVTRLSRRFIARRWSLIRFCANSTHICVDYCCKCYIYTIKYIMNMYIYQK